MRIAELLFDCLAGQKCDRNAECQLLERFWQDLHHKASEDICAANQLLAVAEDNEPWDVLEHHLELLNKRQRILERTELKEIESRLMPSLRMDRSAHDKAYLQLRQAQDALMSIDAMTRGYEACVQLQKVSNRDT